MTNMMSKVIESRRNEGIRTEFSRKSVTISVREDILPSIEVYHLSQSQWASVSLILNNTNK